MEHPGNKYPFVRGEKVVYTPDGTIYDFGYWGQTGRAIVYEEGKCNMQSDLRNSKD